jgi:pimeloyl-ACP methyl ester carboxylesterase
MISSRTADTEGVTLHYLTAGQGAPVILLHGYAETSLMWEPIIPTLAERFTVYFGGRPARESVKPLLSCPGDGDRKARPHGCISSRSLWLGVCL